MGSVWFHKCKLALVVSTTGETIQESTTLLGSWLIAYGLVFVALGVLYCPLKVRWMAIFAEHDYDGSADAWQLPKLRKLLITIVSVLTICSLTWIAYGGWLLFSQKGKICKHSTHGGGHDLYRATLAYWILMLIGLLPLVILILDAWENSEED